jgi:hypothetical protein
MVVHPRGSQRGSQPHAPRARLMVLKSISNSLSSSVATWAFSGRAHDVTKDHPVYISRYLNCSSPCLSALSHSSRAVSLRALNNAEVT